MKRLFNTISMGENFACNVVKIKEDILVLLFIMSITNLVLIDVSAACSKPGDCHCMMVKEKHEAYCEGYKDMPADLDENIESLTMFNNHLQKLTKDSFVKYRSLRVLNLTLSGIGREINLAPLKKLKILDLSGNTYLHSVSLPEDLEEVYLDENTALSYYFEGTPTPRHLFSAQTSLKRLSLKDIDLDTFPVLGNVGHTLEVLDLRNNPKIKEITVDNLARLCKLKKLHLETEHLFMTDTSKGEYCLVCNWIRTYDIEIDNLKCSTTDCLDAKFDSVILQKREECLDKAKTAPYMNFVKSYGLYTSVGLLIVGLCTVLLIIHCRSQRKLRRLRKESLCRSDRFDEEQAVPSHTLV